MFSRMEVCGSVSIRKQKGSYQVRASEPKHLIAATSSSETENDLMQVALLSNSYQAVAHYCGNLSPNSRRFCDLFCTVQGRKRPLNWVYPSMLEIDPYE